MDVNDRIYVPPKIRGALPRRYRLAIVVGCCVGLTVGFWLVLR